MQNLKRKGFKALGGSHFPNTLMKQIVGMLVLKFEYLYDKIKRNTSPRCWFQDGPSFAEVVVVLVNF
jgi:hypothetical protein